MARVELASVDLNLLVVLDVLLDEHSVTAAARRLGRTQSAISHALGRLRETFADPLLVRVGSAMRPTPRAEALREPLASLLAASEALVFGGRSFDPSTARLRLRVSASDYLQLVVLLPVLAHLRDLAPGIDVEVLGPRPGYVDALAQGDLDLAMVVGPQPRGIEQIELLDDRFMCVLGPRLKLRRMTLARYLDCEHVLASPLGGARGFVDAALSERGLERRIAVQLPNFLIVLRLIASSELITTLPERLIRAVASDLELRSVRPPLELPTLKLGVAWHHRTSEDPAMIWVREQFVAAAASVARAR